MKIGSALILVTVGFAGCIGDGDDVGDASEDLDTASAGAPQLLSFSGCADQFGLFPIPVDAASAYLPEGFETVPFPIDPLGLFASWYLVGSSCAEGATDAASIAETRELNGGILVTPPAYLHQDTIDLYAVLFGIMTTSEDAAAAYQAWGINETVVADVGFSIILGQDGVRLGTTGGTDEGFSIDMITTALGPGGTGPEGVIRLFGVSDGVVTGAVDLHWTEATYAEGVSAYIEFVDGLPGLPVPGAPGFGAQTWGEDYAYHVMPVALPEMPVDEEEEAALPSLPLDGLFGLDLT